MTEENFKEIKCKNCGKNIYVNANNIRKNMFCTIKCMEEFEAANLEQVT